MSLLKNLKVNKDIAEEKDRLGGGSFLLDTDIYLCKIEHAYVSESEKKALAINVKFNTEVDGQKKTFRMTQYFTSNEEKGCKTTYEKDGKEHNLPGFNTANHLCLLATGTPLNELDTEDKMLKIYNPEAKAEAPTKVPCIVELFDQEIYVALQRQVVDKTTKESGYQPTGETREINEVDKFFHAETKLTVAEILADAEAPVFFEQWLNEFKGKVINKAKGVQGAAGAPAKGAAPGASATKGAAKPLFGKK
jgi:hypothetical protein